MRSTLRDKNQCRNGIQGVWYDSSENVSGVTGVQGGSRKTKYLDSWFFPNKKNCYYFT